MYNNNFPFIPDFNPFNKIVNLEENINKLNKNIKRLEERVTKLEKVNNKPYISTTNQDKFNYNYEDDDGMYMM